jgi:diaminopimelate decarboxylase
MDMGGGLGIAYTRGDEPPSVEAFADMVMDSVAEEWDAAGLQRPRVMVELPAERRVG